MPDRFPQDAPGKETSVPERVGLVDKQQVQSPLERKVLETIVQNQGVRLKVVDCKTTCLDAIFVRQHDGPGEIGGQHERFVSRLFGIQQDPLAIADDFGGDLSFFQSRDQKEGLGSSLLL